MLPFIRGRARAKASERRIVLFVYKFRAVLFASDSHRARLPFMGQNLSRLGGGAGHPLDPYLQPGIPKQLKHPRTPQSCRQIFARKFSRNCAEIEVFQEQERNGEHAVPSRRMRVLENAKFDGNITERRRYSTELPVNTPSRSNQKLRGNCPRVS
ncbi:hypothetical protein ALC57_08496 [Trachymyrmex cornetzi]|uniref:Uncharacterized protein n=1 Tax=Trachymyrmex cornetzi TaxID=471704 RepID=A0A195E1X1_9HYME|nr:hypothetical protein ALC57_08496 [Trachymyrmex cornetzi]